MAAAFAHGCGMRPQDLHPLSHWEIIWTFGHWLGIRNIAGLIRLMPGYNSMHFSARPRSNSSGPVCALTIDDALGENATGIELLLDLLDEYAVRVTFFVIADDKILRPDRQDLLRRVVVRGHEIGNHGLKDEAMASMDRAECDQALIEWEHRIDSIVPEWPARRQDWKWF